MKKVGLALGGGGAWSIASLGVLKVFEEEGIPIDYLAGCSMGALIAAAYASNFAEEKTLLEVEAIVSQLKLSKTLRIERKKTFGLFSSKVIGEGFEEKVGKLRFEDLKIPVSIVATDFKTGEEVIFTHGPIAPPIAATSSFVTNPEILVKSGPIAPALNASASFPILFTPFHYQGRILTDGGISNPVCADVVRNMGADVVIAVDVVGRRHLTRVENVNKKLPWHKKVIALIPPLHYVTSRKLGSTFNQVIDLLFTNLNRGKLQDSPPDFLLTPEVHHLEQFSFHYAKEYMAAGEKAAREIIPDLKKTLGIKS